MVLVHLPREALPRAQFTVDACHQHECGICPLRETWDNLKHPNMPPSGAERPEVVILGEAPGKLEDEKGEQFVGGSGQLLRSLLPREFKNRVGFINTVACRPERNRDPLPKETECCRPRTIKYIERVKPQVIIGTGNVPLSWVLPPGSNFEGVKLWRGRLMPVKVGVHVCWYFPIYHPAFLLRNQRVSKRGDAIPSAEELITKLDLKRLAALIKEGLPEPRVVALCEVFDNIELVTGHEPDAVKRVIDGFRWAFGQPAVGIDYETNQLRPYSDNARILTVAIATRECGIAVALGHPDAGWTDAEQRQVWTMYLEFLKKYRGRRYVHNLSFELEWTAVCAGDNSLVRMGDWHDTMSQAAILDERRGERKPGAFSLEFLVQQHFGFNLKQLTRLDKANLTGEPVDVVLRYNGGDARYHCELGERQHALIKAAGLEEPYRLALRRVPTIVLSQIKGVQIDQGEVARLKEKYEARREVLEKQIRALPVVKDFAKERGHQFELMSNPDTLYIFKDMLRREECEVWDKWAKETKYSVDKKVLDKIDHPLAKLLVEYRESNKRLSTYILPLDPIFKSTVIHGDGFVHTNYNPVFAETGRLSSDKPNSQNYPKRNEEGKELRRPFVARPGCIVVSVDLGQIEARVIAMFTRDKRFVKALWEEYDVHMEWAERIAHAYPSRIGGKKNLADKKVMKTFRTDIKNQWTFPLFFGAQLGSAAEYLKIPIDVLRPQYEEFWRQFSGVRDWQEEVQRFYREHGYVECKTGRRRHGPLSLNQIINTPIQGTAAEIIMDTMSRLSETGNPLLQPEFQIHDDLTWFSIPENQSDELCEQIIDMMINIPFEWAHVVPITVEMSVGTNWMPYSEKDNPEGLKEVGVFSSATWGK